MPKEDSLVEVVLGSGHLDAELVVLARDDRMQKIDSRAQQRWPLLELHVEMLHMGTCLHEAEHDGLSQPMVGRVQRRRGADGSADRVDVVVEHGAEQRMAVGETQLEQQLPTVDHDRLHGC